MEPWFLRVFDWPSPHCTPGSFNTVEYVESCTLPSRLSEVRGKGERLGLLLIYGETSNPKLSLANHEPRPNPSPLRAFTPACCLFTFLSAENASRMILFIGQKLFHRQCMLLQHGSEYADN